MVLKQVNLSPFENKTLLLPFTSHFMSFLRNFVVFVSKFHGFVKNWAHFGSGFYGLNSNDTHPETFVGTPDNLVGGNFRVLAASRAAL